MIAMQEFADEANKVRIEPTETHIFVSYRDPEEGHIGGFLRLTPAQFDALYGLMQKAHNELNR